MRLLDDEIGTTGMHIYTPSDMTCTSLRVQIFMAMNHRVRRARVLSQADVWGWSCRESLADNRRYRRTRRHAVWASYYSKGIINKTAESYPTSRRRWCSLWYNLAYLVRLYGRLANDSGSKIEGVQGNAQRMTIWAYVVRSLRELDPVVVRLILKDNVQAFDAPLHSVGVGVATVTVRAEC